MITYVLVARMDVIDRLSEGDRDTLLAAASTEITEAWSRMDKDDSAILDEMSAKGATITKIADLKPRRNAVSPVSAAFATRFPDTWGALQVQLALSGN